MDAIETLVKHIIHTTFEDLPPEVVSVTKKSLIDTLGVIIAGSSIDGCKLLVDYIREWGGRRKPIAAFGARHPVSQPRNGAMVRALRLMMEMPFHFISGSIILAVLPHRTPCGVRGRILSPGTH
jgi:2-methylcitrate dehydratase PrpD